MVPTTAKWNNNSRPMGLLLGLPSAPKAQGRLFLPSLSRVGGTPASAHLQTLPGTQLLEAIPGAGCGQAHIIQVPSALHLQGPRALPLPSTSSRGCTLRTWLPHGEGADQRVTGQNSDHCTGAGRHGSWVLPEREPRRKQGQSKEGGLGRVSAISNDKV